MFWYRHMHYSGTSSSAASHVDIWDHKPAKRIMIKKITQLTETYYEKVPSAISYHSSVSTRIANCCHIIIFLLCLPPWGSWVRPRVHYWWPPAPTKQHSQYKKKRNQNGNQSFPNFQRLGSRHQNKHIPLPPFPSFGIPLVEKTIELDNVFSWL